MPNQENTIITVLKELCVPAGNKGFRYLVTAINAVLEDESRLSNMTNSGGIYDIVAKTHDTTIKRVERALRHGIECSFAKSDKQVLIKYIGFADRKATNRDFIAAVAYEIKSITRK